MQGRLAHSQAETKEILVCQELSYFQVAPTKAYPNEFVLNSGHLN